MDYWLWILGAFFIYQLWPFKSAAEKQNERAREYYDTLCRHREPPDRS